MNWLIVQLIAIYEIAIIIRVILSWVPIEPGNKFSAVIREITEPVLRPIRKVLPDGMGFDLSPLIVLIGLHFIKSIFKF
ncbi:MAG: YggT family protein [bacterium]